MCICGFPQRQGAVEQRFDRAGLAATTPSDLTASIPPVPLTERTAVANTTGNAAKAGSSKKKTTRKPPKRAPRKKAAQKTRAVASGARKRKTK